MNNPFQVLGLDSSCTAEELRSAYRTLARRWHPDRFLEGPERDWANEHMTEINSAYQECAKALKNGTAGKHAEVNLDEVHLLIQGHRFSEARRVLLQSKQRGARWNYLFGTVLQGQGEIAKALTYFNFAVRQAPENSLYRSARDAVKRLLLQNRVASMMNALKKPKTIR